MPPPQDSIARCMIERLRPRASKYLERSGFYVATQPADVFKSISS